MHAQKKGERKTRNTRSTKRSRQKNDTTDARRDKESPFFETESENNKSD